MAIEKDARANQGFKWKEAKNLAKIGQNVKVIENGTISKVENNLAVGSVEQIGTVERVVNGLVVNGSNLNTALTVKSEAKVGDKLEFSLKQPYVATEAATKIVVHGKYTSDTTILTKITKPSAAQSNLLNLLPDGGLVIDNSIGGSYAYVVYNKEIYQYITSGTNSLIFVLTQPIEVLTISTNIWNYAFNYINLTGDRTLFHPIFTNEQYQALLNLVK